MIKKAWIVFVAMAFFLCFAQPVFAQTRAEAKIGHISAPFGTSSYVLGAALEEIFKKHPWLHITHSESPGFVFNIKKLAAEPQLKKSMIIGTGAGMKWMAARGLAPFKKKHEPPLNLANYNLVTTWLATLDPNIKSVKDLEGKKVALGRKTQINWAIEPEFILREGWGLGGKVNLQYVGTTPAKTALLDGTVDACIVGGYLDVISRKVMASPQTMELLASGRKVIHLSWTEGAVLKTIQTIGIPIKAITLPANTLQGQPEPIQTFADFNIWSASRELPEDVAYEFVKIVLKNSKRFSEYHALGKLVTPRGMVWGWGRKDMHPGAYKAYTEEGLMK